MNDELAYWAHELIQHGAPAEVQDEIFAYLSRVDLSRFDRALRRLENIVAFVPTSKVDRGRRSRLIGKLYERLLRVLFPKGGALTATPNVYTTTNEIDLLLQVNPLAGMIPALQNVGSHILGEAKCHHKAPSSQLIDEIVGNLTTHAATFGLLFVFCPSKRVGSQCRQAMAIVNAKHNYTIVPIGRKQLAAVRAGAPFMRVLSEQTVLARTHSTLLTV